MQLTKTNFSQVMQQFFLITALSFVLSQIFFPTLWQYNHSTYQLVIDFFCRLAFILIFLLIWYNYPMLSPNHHLIGFCSFLFFALQIIYILNFQDFLLMDYSQISEFHRLSQALIQILVVISILLVTKKNITLKINKYAGLLTALAITLLIFYTALSLALNSVVSPKEILLPVRIFNLSLLVLCIFRLQGKQLAAKIVSYDYLLLAVCLMIVTIFAFLLAGQENSSLLLLAYLLKLSWHYYLFQGIFVNTVTHPYQKLQENQAYLTTILEHFPVGLNVYDADLNFQFISQKGEEILGYKQADLLGLSHKEVYRKLTNQSLEKPSYYQLLNGSPSKNNPLATAITKDGRKVQLKVITHKVADQGLIYLYTEAAQEQELEKIQLQTEALLNAIDNPAIICNKEGKIIRYSKALLTALEIEEEKITGLTTSELKNLFQIEVTNLDQPNKNSEIQGKMYHAQLITATGKKKEFLGSRSFIFNVEGKKIGEFIIGSDITMLTEEQEKMRQQEKLAVLGEMAAGIVHEIKNPLTTIKGFTQLALSSTQEEKTKNYCQIIQKEVQEMNELVSEFLIFAKPQQPVLKRCSLNELLISLQVLLESHCFIEKVNFRLALCPEEKAVLADTNQIKQVILNIVKNALEAMKETTKPQLTVQTNYHFPRREMSISIQDNGCGIKEEVKGKIGTPFFTTKDRGTGLGLSICFQIVREHQGRIDISSKLGEGTSFNIFLPIAKAE